MNNRQAIKSPRLEFQRDLGVALIGLDIHREVNVGIVVVPQPGPIGADGTHILRPGKAVGEIGARKHLDISVGQRAHEQVGPRVIAAGRHPGYPRQQIKVPPIGIDLLCVDDHRRIERGIAPIHFRRFSGRRAGCTDHKCRT